MQKYASWLGTSNMKELKVIYVPYNVNKHGKKSSPCWCAYLVTGTQVDMVFIPATMKWPLGQYTTSKSSDTSKNLRKLQKDERSFNLTKENGPPCKKNIILSQKVICSKQHSLGYNW